MVALSLFRRTEEEAGSYTQPTSRSLGCTLAPCTNCLSKAQTLTYWGEQRNPQIFTHQEILQAVRVTLKGHK